MQHSLQNYLNTKYKNKLIKKLKRNKPLTTSELNVIQNQVAIEDKAKYSAQQKLEGTLDFIRLVNIPQGEIETIDIDIPPHNVYDYNMDK